MDLITELEKLIDELQSIIAEGMGGPHGYNKTHIADALGMQNRLRAILLAKPEEPSLLVDAMKLLDIAGLWKEPVDEQWRQSYLDLRTRYYTQEIAS